MEVDRRKVKLIIRAVENEVSNEKLKPEPNKEDIQSYHQLLDKFYGVNTHWNERVKFKEKIKTNKIRKPSESEHGLPNVQSLELKSGMYDLHYDANKVGEVCGINE